MWHQATHLVAKRSPSPELVSTAPLPMMQLSKLTVSLALLPSLTTMSLSAKPPNSQAHLARAIIVDNMDWEGNTGILTTLMQAITAAMQLRKRNCWPHLRWPQQMSMNTLSIESMDISKHPSLEHINSTSRAMIGVSFIWTLAVWIQLARLNLWTALKIQTSGVTASTTTTMLILVAFSLTGSRWQKVKNTMLSSMLRMMLTMDTQLLVLRSNQTLHQTSWTIILWQQPNTNIFQSPKTSAVKRQDSLCKI